MPYIELLPPPDQATDRRRLGEAPTIDPTARIIESSIGSWTEIGPNCSIEESSLGDYSYASGDNSIIYSEIGKFCSIALHVTINPGNHPMERVTQHHCTYRRVQYGFHSRNDEAFFDWRRAHKCVIGHDVWIGHGAIILPGRKVGTGAVIGSGAVVSRDVEPYQIVAGAPARPIRMRFPADIIEKLLEMAWWDWDRPALEDAFPDLMDPVRFIEKYG